MILFVTGGSSSGKSAFAESAALSLLRQLEQEQGFRVPLWYVATMQPWGSEGAARVEKHRRQRASKGFLTLERYGAFAQLELDESTVAYADCPHALQVDFSKKGVVLLECMGNLVADVLYDSKGDLQPRHHVFNEAQACMDRLASSAQHVVVVGNQVGADGISYSDETRLYIELLGTIQCKLAAHSDCVVELVSGVPMYVKGGHTW